MSSPSHRSNLPWWCHGMVWFVISGPLLVVVAAIATAIIAVRGADPVVASAGADEPQSRPAVQARNHAATPAPSR